MSRGCLSQVPRSLVFQLGLPMGGAGRRWEGRKKREANVSPPTVCLRQHPAAVMSPLSPWPQIPLCRSRPAVGPECSQRPCPMGPGTTSAGPSSQGVATSPCGSQSLGRTTVSLWLLSSAILFHPLCHQYTLLYKLKRVSSFPGCS